MKVFSEELLAADSFLVKIVSGSPHAVALEKHTMRFTNHCLTAVGRRFGSVHQAEVKAPLENFLLGLPHQLAALNTPSFPRLECLLTKNGIDFLLRQRPSPQLSKTLKITAQTVQKFQNPDIKGPNISEYAALNAKNSGETLLLDQGGSVLETVTSSLVWWQDDVLNVVPNECGNLRVASVTEAVLKELADELGYAIRYKNAELSDLLMHEAWALNALHGIRPVSEILSEVMPEPGAQRLHDFLQKYSERFKKIEP